MVVWWGVGRVGRLAEMTTIGNERFLALSDERDWRDRGLALAGIKHRLLAPVVASGWLGQCLPQITRLSRDPI